MAGLKQDKRSVGVGQHTGRDPRSSCPYRIDCCDRSGVTRTELNHDSMVACDL